MVNEKDDIVEDEYEEELAESEHTKSKKEDTKTQIAYIKQLLLLKSPFITGLKFGAGFALGVAAAYLLLMILGVIFATILAGITSLSLVNFIPFI